MRDNIIELLSLAPDASEPDILAALGRRLEAHATAVAEIERLRTLAKAGGLPKSITPEMLERKLRAGLDKGTAIDVLLAQAEHDKNLEAQEKKGAKAK